LSDQGGDRRFNDQAFKLDITREIAEVKAELKLNSAETKAVKEDVQKFHDEFDRALFGSLMDTGLIGQLHENSHETKSLKRQMFKVFPFILFFVFLFGEQVNPIIRQWIYAKTHMELFKDPVKAFEDEKKVTHVKHYTYVIKNDSEEKD
jgi:hypothetical protein